MIQRSFPFLLISLLLLTSCDKEMVYDQYVSLENGSWKWNDVAVFDIDVTDTLSLNNIFIQVRHSTDYPPEQSLYVCECERPQWTIQEGYG